VLLVAVFPVCFAYGQQTVFDVPSADVLDKGKVYGELDGTVRLANSLATFTPRVVIGVGHQIEVGMNFDGPSAPILDQLEISPTVKWRLWKGKTSGWSFYVGDDVYLPVRNGPTAREIMFTRSSRRSGNRARGLVLADTTLRETWLPTLIAPVDSAPSSSGLTIA
jgi:hypothetical protein